MSRIAITPERYQAFLDAFLSLGNRPNAVAKRLGCEPATAKKAWEKGWPEATYGAPIARVYAAALMRLDSAKRDAEGKKATMPQEAIESAPQAPLDGASPDTHAAYARRPSAAAILQQSAIDATQTEVDLLQAFRCNLIGAVTVSNRILKGFEALAIAATENAITAAENVAQVTPDRLLRPLEKFARIMTMLTTSTKSVVEMQRLLVGAPQQITEARGVDATDLHERMARAGKVLDQMRRSGLLPADGQTQQIESTLYEGEETRAQRQGPAAAEVMMGDETTDDSERSGDDVPTKAA